MSKPRHYDPEYKAQAVKLAQGLGSANKAARELGISKDTIYGWMKASLAGRKTDQKIRHRDRKELSDWFKNKRAFPDPDCCVGSGKKLGWNARKHTDSTNSVL